MSTRNHVLAHVFLMAVLAFAVFAAKRLLFRPRPATGSSAVLPKHSGSAAAKPAGEKPSAAVTTFTNPPHSASAVSTPAPSAPSPSAPASASPAAPIAAPAPKAQEHITTPSAGETVAAAPRAQAPAARASTPATEDNLPRLRFGSGAHLWIRVTAISRKPDGSFTFRGTLLQPVSLANRNQVDRNQVDRNQLDRNQLDPGTGVTGSGGADNGHVRVLVSAFTIAGANYELLDSGGSNGRVRTR